MLLIDAAAVHTDGVAVQRGVKGASHRQGNSEMAREPIAGARRDDGKRDAGANQRRRGFIDGAVTAAADNEVVAIMRGLGGELGGVFRSASA